MPLFNNCLVVRGESRSSYVVGGRGMSMMKRTRTHTQLLSIIKILKKKPKKFKIKLSNLMSAYIKVVTLKHELLSFTFGRRGRLLCFLRRAS